jgi:hypothetical protein
MNSEKNQDQDQGQHQDQESPEESWEGFSFSEFVSWIVSHRSGGRGHNHRRIKQESPNHENPVISDIKEARASQVKETKDKLLNVTRATGANRANRGNRVAEKTSMECMICGKEIRSNQAFRALPKDKNCQEERVYHVRTCGPGSKNWMAFKENGKKALRESISGGQMSFEWTSVTRK